MARFPGDPAYGGVESPVVLYGTYRKVETVFFDSISFRRLTA
jgi:hypothetical protein